MAALNFEKAVYRLLAGLIVLLVLLALYGVFREGSAIENTLLQANPALVLVAIAFTAVSLGASSVAFVLVCRLFDIHSRAFDLFRIAFISSTLNNFTSLGGAAGHSFRLLMLRQRGEDVKIILTASMFYAYFNTLSILTLLPLGLLWLFLNGSLASGVAVAVAVGGTVTLILFMIATSIIFSQALRTRLLHLAAGAVRRLTGRSIEDSLQEFNRALTTGISGISNHRLATILQVAMVAVDWVFSIMVLGVCFDALGDPIPAGMLLAGFAIGVAAGIISMIPGGLGIQDTSMAGIYALLGVPVHQAAITMILFRVVYYVIPFLVSLFFYQRLRKNAGE